MPHTTAREAQDAAEASARRIPRLENERFEVIVTVETDVASAFAEARTEVEAEHARREAAYVEAERLRQEEFDARQRQMRIERDAARAQPTTDEPPF